MKPAVSLQTLERMCYISALSGHEEDMIAFMKGEMSRYLADCRVDRLGNVIGCKEGKDPRAPRVMIFAHMDEIGFMVRKIEPDGFIRITRVGGIPEKSLPAQRLTLRGSRGDLLGLIGPKSHHLTPPEEKFKVVEIKDLFVDVGAHSKAEAEAMGLYVGAPATYHGYFSEMPGGQVAGKSLDNRVGCFVLLRVLSLLADKEIPATVYYVGTAQEEFNIRGAQTAAFAIDPSLAIAIDGALSCDTPDLRPQSDIRFGGGPTILHYTFHGRGTLNGLIPNPKLWQYMADVAARLGMPIQHSVFLGGLIDSSYVAVVREGIPAVDMAFPLRYSHSPVEVASLPDIEQLSLLLAAALEGMGAGFDLSRG